uniref:Neuron navigator 2a n=1 Tax=Cyprinus carpio TaxID=7962 RepID=A0A8C2CBD4_CYPCA
MNDTFFNFNPSVFRSHNEADGNIVTNPSSGCRSSDSSSFSKINQSSTEDLSVKMNALFSGEDPETRRLRTVKNIADLRQNLEETMSSLRGTQITHSTLETTFDGSVTTEMSSRSILSMASRPAPLSWASRMGQSSPRLQAGDAPSVGNGYQSRSGGVASGQGRYLYQAPLRKQLAARGSALCGLELGDRAEDLELAGVGLEMSGYMSDGDVLAKNTAGKDILAMLYMTDGGLSLYTRRLNRLPDGMAMVRESLQRNASTSQGDADSWDDSSSVSSGISDAIDTDDINTSSSISSYANTPAASRKALNGQSVDYICKFYALSPRPAVTFFCPIGKTDDAKVSEKGRMSPSSNIVQHSSSDAGRSSEDEAKKTPAGRVPTSTFGFKKPNGVHGPATVVTTSSFTLVTSSGATITSGSATLGKIPKSSALLVGGRGSVKGAVDGLLPPQEDGYLSPSARSMLQYRSLPRPSRSGAAARNGNRSSTSSIESSLSSRTPILTAITTSKPRDSGTKTNGHAIQANQTDKDKGVSGGGAATIPQTARQGNKYSDVSSPTLRRLFGGKAAKQAPVTSAESMKNSVVISNPHATLGHTQSSGGPLDSPSTIPGSGASSPLYGGRGASIGGSEQASSPGSVYSTGTGTWGTTISSSSALGYPSVSSMHTSSESIDMSVGSGHHRDDVHPVLMRTGSAKTGMSERYTPSSHLRQEEARDWLRSHSGSGLQDSASNSPFSTGSSLTSPSGTRFNFAQLGSPTTGAQINLASLRNNSLTNQDNPLDSHGDSRLRNSCMSLDEKNRTMSRSGSFRDGFEEVHGSSLSLVSSTSSVYSTVSFIRKLRRELDASQEKVSALTTQLSANAHLVAAFEQSLGNMTIRLKSLTMTAEQKDSELNELRKTIELLKKQNAVAQAAINGNNGAQPDLRMRRQHSSDSVSSITSATSHSSLGSNMDNPDSNSKKKKKNWLRSSFKQAFSKKKSPKSASSHSDIEEMTDSSLPSSPKLPHNGTSTSALRLHCLDVEAETVMQLRSELREKEMKLTDIRLEALSSAHQLDQLREAMNRMQVEIEKLKVENDRLKFESQASGSRASSQVSVYNPAPTPTTGLSQHSLNLTESSSFDMLLDDSGGDGSSRKESRHVKIVVSLQEDVMTRDFLIGCIGVSGKTKWDVLDGVVRRLFKEYIRHVDPVSHLGLGSDSVEGYRIGDVIRSGGADTPELLPCGYLVGENDTINISLKGSHNSEDSLVFETLIPKPMLQRYVSLLQEHRRIILSGPSGTGKSYLAHRLAEHLALREGKLPNESNIVTFNVDHKSSKELRQYLANIVEQCSAEGQDTEAPLVLILDNLHHISSLGEIFNGLLNCKYQRCPYIIGTMSQATSSPPNLQLHHNFRWRHLCAYIVKGFLGRFLRRKLIETEIGSRTRNPELVKIIDWIPQVWHHLNRFLEAHSSSDVTIGPRLFLSCPMDVDGSRVWFTDLWNYSIIPYMLEAVREGLQLYGRRAAWEDPALWVLETFPWAASHQHPDWPALLQLRPEDVGFDGYSASREGLNKQSTQSDSDADPLVRDMI